MSRVRMHVQKNGHIVVTSRQRGLISTRGARDLQYRLEWFSNQGWQVLSGEIADERAAREALAGQRDRNPSIRWRLVAFNNIGRATVPSNWRGQND